MFRVVLAAALTLAVAAVPATAGVLISTTPAGNALCCDPEVAYESWTQSITYTDVVIQANLFAVSAAAAATGDAYLMNQVGPGTTTANEITSPFHISISNPTSAAVTLFSGLTLGPGDYFLVIGNASGLYWDSGSSFPPSVTLGTGVSQSALPYGLAVDPPYPPATTFVPKSNLAIFSVTGNISATPEPATCVMALVALSGLMLLRRRSSK